MIYQVYSEQSKKAGVEIKKKAKIWKPQLCIISCVTLSKLIYLSELQSPITWGGWDWTNFQDGK